MVGGGGGAVLCVVELMASHGDQRTQARAREATRWRWLAGLVLSGWEQLTTALGGSQWRLFVALTGWLHGLRLLQCCGCHGSHGFNGVNVIWRE